MAGPSVLTEPARVAAVRIALGHLVAVCRRERRSLPVAPVVVVRADVVQMHLAAPLGPAPSPWRTRGHVWSLALADLSAADTTLALGAADGWLAYPGLVDIGRQGDWSVLVDLAAAPGPVSVDGDPAEVHGFLRRMVTELRNAPWSRAGEVVVLDEEADRRSGGAHLGELGGGMPVTGLPAGVTGRRGPLPRGRHRVVVSTAPLEQDARRWARAASGFRDAPTVVAPGGDGVWRWWVSYGEMTW